MQGIEYHNETRADGDEYRSLLSPPPSLPRIHAGSVQRVSQNGHDQRYYEDEGRDGSNRPGEGRAFGMMASTYNFGYGDAGLRDRNITDEKGYGNNDNDATIRSSNEIDDGGGYDGSAEAWWASADKSRSAIPATTNAATSATKTALGPGPPAEVNGIGKPFYSRTDDFNSSGANHTTVDVDVDDRSAHAALINSTFSSACANDTSDFGGLVKDNTRRERVVGINNDNNDNSRGGIDDSYGSESFAHINTDAPGLNPDGNPHDVSNGHYDYNSNTCKSSSSSSGIRIDSFSAVAVGSDRSSSLSSSLSFLPTPPSTATGSDNYRLSSGSLSRFGSFGEDQARSQIQYSHQHPHPPQHQQQSLLQQALQHQTQHTQTGQQQQAHLSHPSAHNAYIYQAQQQQQQQHQGDQEAHHYIRQTEPAEQQTGQQLHQGEHSQTTETTAHSQGMAPTTQAGVMSTTNGVPAKSAISVACMWCRSKHLKCDGGVRCSRCQAEGLLCSYPKSRRGFKGPRKAKALLSARRHDSLTQGKHHFL